MDKELIQSINNPDENTQKLRTPPTFKEKSDNNKANRFRRPLLISAAVLGTALLLILSLLLGLILSPLGKSLIRLARTESYQISATVTNVPILGEINFVQMVDGDISYTPAIYSSGNKIADEKYKKTEGKDVYIYSRGSDGEWTRRLKTDIESSIEEEIANELLSDIEVILKLKNFEKVKGEKHTYRQKDNVRFDRFSSVVIVIGDGEIKVSFFAEILGLHFPATLVLSHIGEIDLALPDLR